MDDFEKNTVCNQIGDLLDFRNVGPDLDPTFHTLNVPETIF